MEMTEKIYFETLKSVLGRSVFHYLLTSWGQCFFHLHPQKTWKTLRVLNFSEVRERKH